MKVVFYNPQMYPVIGRTFYNFLLGIFSYGKYWYLIDHITKYQTLHIFIDSNGTSLLPRWLGKIIIPRLEVYIWLLINHINPFKVKVYSRVDALHSDDILIGFSVGLLDEKGCNLSQLSKINCIKLFHITHFIQNASLLSKNSKKIKIDYFIAENNLFKNSPFFRKYFPWYKKNVYTLPFAFQQRFSPIIPFVKRKSLCLAIGTVVDLRSVQNDTKFIEFIQYFKTTIIQPLRKEILIHRNELKSSIVCLIGELFEVKLKLNYDSFLERLSNAISNATRATKRKYLNFDMVEMFNTYKMFVCGEEINNLPGIGFVEGMASGCAFFGINDPMYTGIGLIPNIHFISHNGSLEDLKRKIIKYKLKPATLEKIATSGCNYVRNNFSGIVVAHTFFEDIRSLSFLRTSNLNAELNCTFENPSKKVKNV